MAGSDIMTLLELLERQVIPWVETHGLKRFVVADDSADKYPLPDGMKLSHVELKGRRVPIHGRRTHGHASNFLADWPDALLSEMRLPYIACIVTGSVDYQVGERMFHVTEGDFLLIPPRVPFPCSDSRLLEDPAQAPDVLAFSTWDNHLQTCICRGTSGNYLFPNHGTVQLLDLLMDELFARRHNWERAGTNLFLAFLTLICRELRAMHYFRSGMALIDSELTEPKLDPIERVQQYVQSHLNEPLTIENAATRALMSRTQFTKRFRQVTGHSYLQYVTNCRLENAKRLLHETDWSVTAVSEFIGFQDSTRLRRIFDEKVGMTPSQYRRFSRNRPANSG